MYIIKECPMCKRMSQMELTQDEYKNFLKYQYMNMLVQDVFPNMNNGEREYLKSGYCRKCQEILFGHKIITKRKWK